MKTASQSTPNFKGDQLSVKMFGALGNGINDDTAAIQDGINVVGARGGGTLYIPAGTYPISADLVVKYDFVRLRGTGQGTVILARAANLKMIHWCASHGGIDHGIHLNANGYSGCTGLRLSPLDETQTVTVVAQDYNSFFGVSSVGCDEGLVMMPGPLVAGVSSGSFYNRFYDYEAANCKRGIWLKDGNSATATGNNRNQFHNARIGQFGLPTGGVGANTGIQIDSGGTNKFFGCSVEDLLAQAYYTDLKIDARTSTKCTSALQPFTASSVGFTLAITSGAGWTVQVVTILSVSGDVATCSAPLGVLASTGGFAMANNGPNPIATAIVVKFVGLFGGGNNDNDFFGFTSEACDRGVQCENFLTSFYGGEGPAPGTNALNVFSVLTARVVYGGNLYSAVPTVTVTGGGNQPGKAPPAVMAIVASLPTPGPVTGFSIANQGEMLSELPTLTITPAAGDTTGFGALALAVLNFPQVAIGTEPSGFPVALPGMLFPGGNLGPTNSLFQNVWNMQAGMFFPLQQSNQLVVGGFLPASLLGPTHGTGLGQIATFAAPDDNWGYPAVFVTDGGTPNGRGPIVCTPDFDVAAGTGKALFITSSSIEATVLGATFDGPFAIKSSTLEINCLSASLPVLTDASKNLISALINLASQVSGQLPTTNGGTGGNYASQSLLLTALLTSLSNVAVPGEFGCNGVSAQAAYASGGAAPTTAPTQTTPYGFTTAAQFNDIITLLNSIRAALVANGIMS